jgi:hypothetical protein
MLGPPSSVPSLISISSEWSSKQNREEPQRGQKRSSPARLRQLLISPDIVTADRGQNPKKEKAEPVSFRQASQWQIPVRVGSPSSE